MNRRLMLSGVIALSIAAIGLPAMAALKVGTKVADFTLPGFKAGKAMTYKLADARKKGPVVVYFFPAAFTGGCDLEAVGASSVLAGEVLEEGRVGGGLSGAARRAHDQVEGELGIAGDAAGVADQPAGVGGDGVAARWDRGVHGDVADEQDLIFVAEADHALIFEALGDRVGVGGDPDPLGQRPRDVGGLANGPRGLPIGVPAGLLDQVEADLALTTRGDGVGA